MLIALPPVCLRGARFLPERVATARRVGERRSRFHVPCPQAGGNAACPPSDTAVRKYGTVWKGCDRWEMRNAQGAHQEQRRWGTRPVCLVPCLVHRNEVFCRKQCCRALLFGTVEPTSVVGTEESGVNWRFEPRTGVVSQGRTRCLRLGLGTSDNGAVTMSQRSLEGRSLVPYHPLSAISVEASSNRFWKPFCWKHSPFYIKHKNPC